MFVVVECVDLGLDGWNVFVRMLWYSWDSLFVEKYELLFVISIVLLMMCLVVVIVWCFSLDSCGN